MSADSPLRGLPARIVGDASADPTEFFTHYDAFGYWVAAKLARLVIDGRFLKVSCRVLTISLSEVGKYIWGSNFARKVPLQRALKQHFILSRLADLGPADDAVEVFGARSRSGRESCGGIAGLAQGL